MAASIDPFNRPIDPFNFSCLFKFRFISTLYVFCLVEFRKLVILTILDIAQELYAPD